MSHRGRITKLLGGAAAVALLMGVGAARAEDMALSIAAQPLGDALNQFAVQSRHSVVFAPGLVAEKVSPGVSNAPTAELALAQLLDGTGLTFRNNGDTFLIVRASDPQSGSAAGDGADGTVQALIVTAQKREEDIQDVPIAISAFTQEDLTRSQVAGGPDLMTQVPNFTFTKTNFSGYSIQIRGIGTQAISATTDPAVAVAFNNTPFIRNRFFEQEFYDLQRVEVLRGPQGTLYGRNATAGVVNIISAKPAHRFEAKLSGDISNYSSSRLEGMINIPLVEDTAALRIAGAWTKRDGYVRNTLTGQQTDGRDLWSTRVSLGLEPNDWLSANLIWEHFEENDDRLRTGKQLCHADPGPAVVNGYPIPQVAAEANDIVAGYVSQGCRPASLYSPDSFDTPNGYALGYYGTLSIIGAPTYFTRNPYANTFQSRNLRDIETHLQPEYTAKTDTAELQLNIDLPGNLSLSSETAFLRDFIFSFSDYNRFNTTPGVFMPGGTPENPRVDLVDANGYFCDPQLGCTNRMAAGDLSTARSRQFSQEFRLSSNFDGNFNFSVGANTLRYDTEEKYYVFINTISSFVGHYAEVWQPGVTDFSECVRSGFYGPIVSDPSQYYHTLSCTYMDPNDIHHLNDQGRNYFLSKNPYHLLSYAAFGEAYYNVTPDLKLTAGLRWTIDKKTAPVIPSWLIAGGLAHAPSGNASYGTPTYKVIEQEWREPTGRVALDWKPDLSFTDETLIYGSYVRGYKAGGANPPPPVLVLATQCPPECSEENTHGLIQHYLTHPETFDPEFVNAFEFGTKNTLLDGRLIANLSGFYYDYQGYQISQIIDRSAINFNFDAEVWGAELELGWRPLENLRLAFKGGYEHTRVADGMEAVDTMDRTAGREGWMVYRPFPSLPSNCVIPIEFALMHADRFLLPIPSAVCTAYALNLDPVTFLPYVPNPTGLTKFGWPLPEGYPGYDPASANNGQGFTKDLSGKELPNAPGLTATITADYTLPLANDWLMTLHTDLYYQSEAWTRIFNTPGYDKLKAYNNVNLAAIFTNEDQGWNVMAYVKNVFDKDNITGAFLNSDDTGLTTNVFLNEPRLYGIRVTKDWFGGPLLGTFGARRKGPYPLTVEFGAQAQRLDTPAAALITFAGAFNGGLDPYALQTEEMDWTDRYDLRLTFRPSGSAWKLLAGMRYGRTSNSTGRLRQEEATGDSVCKGPTNPVYSPYAPGLDLSFYGKVHCDPEYGPVTVDTPFGTFDVPNKYDPSWLLAPTNRLSSTTDRKEEHRIVDFAVGRDVGIGTLRTAQSSLSVGVRYAEFKSSVSGDLRGIPDMDLPDDAWAKYNTTFHQYAATFASERRFAGLGPAITWDASRTLWGNDASGHLNIDWSMTGGALFGRQKTRVLSSEGSDYFNDRYPDYPAHWIVQELQAPAQAPKDIAPRIRSATVPVLDLSLGLSFEVPGVKLSTGYRWERYFNVLDAGFEEHKSFDRTIDGPYLRIAVGFGG